MWSLAHGGGHLLEEMSHFTDETLGLRVDDAGRRGNTAAVARQAHATDVTVGEEVVAQQRRVGQRLNNAVHEARIAEVDQPAQPYTRT